MSMTEKRGSLASVASAGIFIFLLVLQTGCRQMCEPTFEPQRITLIRGTFQTLFDGTSLDAWEKLDGTPAHWKLTGDGAMEVTGGGDLRTKASFGDCQLHIEWRTPEAVDPNIMNRGNSGVIFMGRYEVQVIDSNPDTIYADGIAGAAYGQNPPLVNVCRAPGEWQSFDIIFYAPRWEGDTLLRQGCVTVLHNGVLIQDRWPLEGPTGHLARAVQSPHANKLPLVLQSHGSPVRYRNIWVKAF